MKLLPQRSPCNFRVLDKQFGKSDRALAVEVTGVREECSLILQGLREVEIGKAFAEC